MKTKCFKFSLLFLLFAFCFFFFNFSFAQFEISVSPQVIEEKAKARDILEYSVKIKNQGKNLYHFYTLIENITEGSANDNSLAQWIEIFRGRTEIPTGQEKEIPFSIKIPYNAKPGKYFSQIIFAQGSTEPDARNNASRLNMPKLLLNIEVQEEVVEKLQIKKFQTSENFYFTPKIKFFLELENIGNKEIIPKSSIHVYDRKGQEIVSLELERKSLLPKEIKNFEINWQSSKKIGQFKAVVFGVYGQNNEKVFQDSTYFGIFSWQFLILIFLIFLIILFLIIWLFSKILKRRYSKNF